MSVVRDRCDQITILLHIDIPTDLVSFGDLPVRREGGLIQRIIFGGNEQEVDLNRIQRVAVFRAKSGECLCAATIDGKKLQPRSVSPSQWQRLWVAPDRDSYKQNLAASLFADVLQKDNNVEQSTQEKQEEATEVKQAETAIVDKHDEQKEVVLKEDKSSEQREEKKQEEKKEEKKDEKAVKAAVSPLVQQYLDLKKKHPDAILLFRCGDFLSGS